MELRKGITGFRHVDDPPLPNSDLTLFRSHCFEAARTLGVKVLRPARRPKNVEASFAWAVLELPV